MEFSSFLTPATGATGVLTLVVMLILWGKLVPRAQLEDLRADKDKQIETWQQAYSRSEEARDIMRGQITELLQMARTTNSVIEALPAAVSNPGRRSRVDIPAEEG
jgi:5-methylcytosine-specific restriction endonuclease McrBC regulatory subunit McrC